MTKSIQIQIDQPCHENWQAMTPNEQGRFCGSCQKTVMDFSTMTDQEILDHISKATSNICGRVTNDQMNRDIKTVEKKKRYTLAYIWNILLATFLLAKADAQVTPVKNKKPVTAVAPDAMIMGKIAPPDAGEAVMPVVVKGTVIDSSNNQPVPYATIMINGTKRGVKADSLGNFKISIDDTSPVELVVSFIGYTKQTILVDKNTNWQQIKIALQPSVMKEVVVVSNLYKSLCGRMGGISYKRTITRTQKIKRTVSDLLPKKDIKAFPNPTIRGNNIQVNLALQQAGEYKLELMDATGKVMMMQAVQMPEKQRTISVLTNEAWSAGVYWIRISGQHVKNVYQTKVLLQ